MAVFRYRLREIATVEDIGDAVPGPISVATPSVPVMYEDVTAPVGSKDDLDAFMASRGFVFDPSNPATTPAQVPAWFVDPVAGDDTASGETALTPVRTYAEIVRRWESIAPLLLQNTTITFLSDQPDLSDPVAVIGQNGASAGATLSILGSLTSQGAPSTFTGVVAKNRATNTRWSITDGAQPAAFWSAFVGYLVHDITADAWFWVNKDLGASTAEITEPLQSAVGNLTPPMIPIANGDSYEIFAPTRVNVVRFGLATASELACEIRHLWSFGDGELLADGAVIFTECRIDPFLVSDEVAAPTLSNCYQLGFQFSGGFVIGGAITFEAAVSGGIETVIDGDCLVDGPAISVQGPLLIGTASFANTIEVPPLNLGAATGELYVSPVFYGVGILWGSGAVNVHVGGDLGYQGSAVASFLNTGGLSLDGAGVASNYNLVTGIWIPGIALTPANLDAAVPGGFGGVAYGVKGSKIRSIS